MAKPVSRKTFQTMVEPPKEMDRILHQVSIIKEEMKDLILRYVPNISEIPLHQGLSFEPTWKALPTVRVTHSVLYNRCKLEFKKVRKVRSIFPSFFRTNLLRGGGLCSLCMQEENNIRKAACGLSELGSHLTGIIGSLDLTKISYL